MKKASLPINTPALLIIVIIGVALIIIASFYIINQSKEQSGGLLDLGNESLIEGMEEAGLCSVENKVKIMDNEKGIVLWRQVT